MTDLFQDTLTIKTVSLWQPWASLMAAGIKLHDVRHWAPAHRGPIAIHAAKTIDVVGAPEDLCVAALGVRWRQLLPIGMVLAVGELTACVEASRLYERLTRADKEAGNFAPGHFAWRIEKPRALKAPIPLAGRQGLFNWTAPLDLGGMLHHAVDHHAACRYIGWA